MKKKNITIDIEVLDFDELNATESALVNDAREATRGSYAPYSHFKVGAAILLDNGVTVTGANQENAAFPSGTCAERSACFYAGAKYPDVKFKEIAIAAIGTDGEWLSEPIPPCGACRQALLEYEKLAGDKVPVLLVGKDYVYRLESVLALLPLAFATF